MNDTNSQNKNLPIAIAFLLVMVCCFLMVTCLTTVVTDGPSMEPTYTPGTRLLVSKIPFSYESGDIVLLKHEDRLLVKRIIAAPGEEAYTLALPAGTEERTEGSMKIFKNVYAEGTDYDAGTKTFSDTKQLRPWESGDNDESDARSYAGYWTSYFYWQEAHGTTLVPDGYFFVCGDNLNHSLDSRDQDFGLVPRNEIIGRVIWSFGERSES